MANYKAQRSNDKSSSKPKYQMAKIQRTKRYLPLEYPDFILFPRNPPLKIRGARGVMKIYGNNPLYPPYFKGGDLREGAILIFRHLNFDIWASVVVWILAFGIQ
jgi:hypothetical protein